MPSTPASSSRGRKARGHRAEVLADDDATGARRFQRDETQEVLQRIGECSSRRGGVNAPRARPRGGEAPSRGRCARRRRRAKRRRRVAKEGARSSWSRARAARSFGEAPVLPGRAEHIRPGAPTERPSSTSCRRDQTWLPPLVHAHRQIGDQPDRPCPRPRRGAAPRRAKRSTRSHCRKAVGRRPPSTFSAASKASTSGLSGCRYASGQSWKPPPRPLSREMGVQRLVAGRGSSSIVPPSARKAAKSARRCGSSRGLEAVVERAQLSRA